eukprot:SAG31_NODE_2944_length_4874_cov_30.998953_4_plen_65_part_00
MHIAHIIFRYERPRIPLWTRCVPFWDGGTRFTQQRNVCAAFDYHFRTQRNEKYGRRFRSSEFMR